MMLNKGKYGGERILSRPSVELMTTDQLTPGAEGGVRIRFFPGFWDSRGWGFGVAIDHPARRSGGDARPVRLGRRLRHIVVRRPRRRSWSAS